MQVRIPISVTFNPQTLVAESVVKSSTIVEATQQLSTGTYYINMYANYLVNNNSQSVLIGTITLKVGNITPAPSPNNKFAYFTNSGNNSYTQCTVNSSDGSLSACNTVIPSGKGALDAPSGITMNNGYAYITNRNGKSYTQCTVNSSDGTLSACNTVTPSGSGVLDTPSGIAVNNGYAYITNARNNSYTQCTVSSLDGTLSSCNTVTPSGSGALVGPLGIAFN